MCRSVLAAPRTSERCSVLPSMTDRWWPDSPSDGPPFTEVSEIIQRMKYTLIFKGTVHPNIKILLLLLFKSARLDVFSPHLRVVYLLSLSALSRFPLFTSSMFLFLHLRLLLPKSTNDLPCSGSNPCELSCLALGHNFYYNFGRVLDGTACDKEPGAVCVNGRCLVSGNNTVCVCVCVCVFSQHTVFMHLMLI